MKKWTQIIMDGRFFVIGFERLNSITNCSKGNHQMETKWMAGLEETFDPKKRIKNERGALSVN